MTCFHPQALWIALRVEAGDLDPLGPALTPDVLDPFFCQPYRDLGKPGQLASTGNQFKEVIQVKVGYLG